MKLLLKPLFEILTGEISVCDNIVYNYIVLLVVGEIAFRIAFQFVRNLYMDGIIEGKCVGSLLHWIFRFFIYVVVAYVIEGTIKLYYFVTSIPKIVWLMMISAIIILAFLYRYVKGILVDKQK